MRRQSLSALSLALAFSFAACGGPASTSTDGGADAAPDLASAPGPADRFIDLPQFTLQPGDEKTLCAYVPPDMVDRNVSEFVTEMTPGSHHLIVLRVPSTGMPASGAMPCNLGIPSGMLPGAQQPHTDIQLPPGIAFKMSGSDALLFQMHYINATMAPITAHVTYTMKSIADSAVKDLAGELFYSQWKLDVPPGKSTQSLACKAPQDMSLLLSTGHMHMHGTAFDATVNGTNVFHTSNWDQPNWQNYGNPGYSVKQGDAIGWGCTYDNETGGDLHFGDSAVTNEMCIFAALYWPSSASQTLFLCNQ